ncbi:DUF2567 domain-containing protein [Nocardia arizonensis]|uniref:DUF2567 domain-containing protein n=1 Tax=Nocardia arizonensis TaxID=1141647 RepID=UPI0009EA5D4A|nr:DUF2567 domain-containing protein [Nocardia arizonensis]
MRGAEQNGLRREVGAGLTTVAAVAVAGIVGGVIWGLLAPAEQLLVTQPGRGAALTGESVHQFDSVAIFVCIGAALGVLSAASAWRLRGVRGPILQLGVLLGAALSACVMRLVGEAVAEWHHPRPDDPPVGQIISIAPVVGTALALIVQPLIASLVMLFLAALSPREDLGTGFGGAFGGSRPVPRYGPNAPEPVSGLIPYGTPIPYEGHADPLSRS